MSNIVLPRVASGFLEYSPKDQIEFERLKGIVREIYEKYGFSPIDTVSLELKEVLLAKGGGETEKEVYELSRGHNDFALPFDLTVPLARYVVQHRNEIILPFRRYAIAKVHRAERAQAGRFREFTQCDVDVIGSESPLVDAEMLQIINEVLTKFNIGDFQIRVSDRRILQGFLRTIGLNDRIVEVTRMIDKIAKITEAEFIAELKKIDLNEHQIAAIQKLITIAGTNQQIVDALDNLNINDDDFRVGVANLRSILLAASEFGVDNKNLAIDLKITRGLDYYTGMVCETFLNKYPELGSIYSGGRYDHLAEYYTKEKLPGVGVSIGLTRLFYKLKELGLVKSDQKTVANTVVLPMSDEQNEFAIKIANKLRKNNITTILYSESGKFAKKIGYADRIGVKYAIIVGDDEVKNDSVSVKNMQTGETKSVVTDDLVSEIK